MKIKEGINATVEGDAKNAQKYKQYIINENQFGDIHFKVSQSKGNSFPKLSVKVRDELVSVGLGEGDVDPNQTTGKHLKPKELHEWFKSDKEFYIVDMRNNYEIISGHFRGSLFFEDMDNFRDLPKVLPQINHLKGKTILTVCTGGVRCEKASGYMIKNGFENVYQLDGGIVSYMEKYPNQDFLGKLYVFDNRVIMGFNVESKDHIIVGKCEICGVQSENYIDYKSKQKGRHHGIVCPDCIKKGKVIIG